MSNSLFAILKSQLFHLCSRFFWTNFFNAVFLWFEILIDLSYCIHDNFPHFFSVFWFFSIKIWTKNWYNMSSMMLNLFKVLSSCAFYLLLVQLWHCRIFLKTLNKNKNCVLKFKMAFVWGWFHYWIYTIDFAWLTIYSTAKKSPE